MKRATVIIGANYGDEGKGLLTDFHAASIGSDALVVRFNGGAQAGHTVVTPDGRRNVFSHVGSGAFAGARTFLSRFFVANPMLFHREVSVLAKLGVVPAVSIDRLAPVTTPWDMLVNQAVETARGALRHGSCGIGFGETIERNLDPRFALTVTTLADHARLARTLDAIRTDYVPMRLSKLGLAERWVGLRDLAMSDDLFDRYLGDVEAFRAAVAITDTSALGDAARVIFEGAQGLLLDQDRGAFPHVTRSNTGLRNALMLAQEAGIDTLDVTYVTRAYVTRHGAGPLPHELDGPPDKVRDCTNVSNAWQGSLRFAWLDLDIVRQAIAADLSDVPPSIRITLDLAVTCLDQLGSRTACIEDGQMHRMSPEALAAVAGDALGAVHLYTGTGPTRADIAAVRRDVRRVA
jgi:adenylosuccinate synthase